jgi:salicylate hydroxylase/6-hydroxynicotinate 3-monooxygenase
MARPLSVAIVGAGMGGLATAAALRRVGVDVMVYEQASQFARIGAGIQIGCNAMKVLRALGLEARMREHSFYPRSWNNRDWRTGEVKFDMIFGESAEQKFGAPYLLAHRGDLHAALASSVPDECVKLNHKLVGLEESGEGVRMIFANGASVTADAVIGADGIHSIVRDILFGTSPVSFTGRIAYRTTYPAALLGGAKIDDCTKWWGEDRHIVIYYVKPDRSEIYLVTSQPEPEFRIESWSAKGDVVELRKAFAGFHRQVEQLLGDACHPMTPYMAQGAAMAIEDAAVLSRCLDGVEREGVANAFRRFEATRKARTARIQETSRANIWLSGKTDADWVYGYDAWTVPLAA